MIALLVVTLSTALALVALLWYAISQWGHTLVALDESLSLLSGEVCEDDDCCDN